MKIRLLVMLMSLGLFACGGQGGGLELPGSTTKGSKAGIKSGGNNNDNDNDKFSDDDDDQEFANDDVGTGGDDGGVEPTPSETVVAPPVAPPSKHCSCDRMFFISPSPNYLNPKAYCAAIPPSGNCSDLPSFCAVGNNGQKVNCPTGKTCGQGFKATDLNFYGNWKNQPVDGECIY